MFDVFSNVDFIKNLTAKNQTLEKRLANHIGELVQKIREAVKMRTVLLIVNLKKIQIKKE